MSVAFDRILRAAFNFQLMEPDLHIYYCLSYLKHISNLGSIDRFPDIYLPLYMSLIEGMCGKELVTALCFLYNVCSFRTFIFIPCVQLIRFWPSCSLWYCFKDLVIPVLLILMEWNGQSECDALIQLGIDFSAPEIYSRYWWTRCTNRQIL